MHSSAEITIPDLEIDLPARSRRRGHLRVASPSPRSQRPTVDLRAGHASEHAMHDIARELAALAKRSQLGAALAFVAGEAHTRALGSLAWFDEDAHRFELAELRRRVANRAGLDLGFDAADELFCAMVAARTLGRTRTAPGLVRQLCRSFADNHWERRYRFFATANGFAADTDCTSVALAALYQAGLVDRAELDKGVAGLVDNGCRDERDGLREHVVLVYWDDDREPGVTRRDRKQDAAVSANVLYAVLLAVDAGFMHPQLEAFIDANLAYVRDSLEQSSRTRYYGSPDALPWFAGELCARFPRARAALGRSLRGAAVARCESGAGDAIELAMRIMTAMQLGLDTTALVRQLATQQLPSGGFEPGAFFTLGRVPGLCFGSAGLTTALAALALGAEGARA